MSPKKSINYGKVSIKKVTQLTLVSGTQKIKHGLVDFFAHGSPCAFIEFAMVFGIKLKKVQTLHIQPLMSKTGNEIMRPVILNQSIYLSP